jgi:hypothetical protein
MVLESTGLVKALPQLTASRPTPVVSGAPPADSTPFNQTDEHKSPSHLDLTHTNHLVPDMVDALQLPRIGC